MKSGKYYRLSEFKKEYRHKFEVIIIKMPPSPIGISINNLSIFAKYDVWFFDKDYMYAKYERYIGKNFHNWSYCINRLRHFSAFLKFYDKAPHNTKIMGCSKKYFLRKYFCELL